MKLKENLKLFWADNGKFLLKVFGGIFIIISVVRTLDYMAKVSIESNNKENVIIYDIQSINDEMPDILINSFIILCNNGNLEQAYDILSESCKTEKYNTIENFKLEFYDKIFICEMDIFSIEIIEDEYYKVKLIENAVSSGKTEKLRTNIIFYKKDKNTDKIYVEV